MSSSTRNTPVEQFRRLIPAWAPRPTEESEDFKLEFFWSREDTALWAEATVSARGAVQYRWRLEPGKAFGYAEGTVSDGLPPEFLDALATLFPESIPSLEPDAIQSTE